MHPKVAAFASLFPPFIRHAKTDPLRNAKTLRNSQVFLPSPKFTHSIPRRSRKILGGWRSGIAAAQKLESIGGSHS
jgi:hypothetical protein